MTGTTGGMRKTQVSSDVDNDRLHLQTLGQHQTIEKIHRLGEDDLLVNRLSRDGREEDLFQRKQNLQALFLGCNRVAARSSYQGFESDAIEDEEECDGLISIIDVGGTGDAVRHLTLRLAVKGVKYQSTVLFDEAGDSIDEFEPRVLIELCRMSQLGRSAE